MILDQFSIVTFEFIIYLYYINFTFLSYLHRSIFEHLGLVHDLSALEVAQ